MFWPQAALRRAHRAMLDSRSSDLLRLARVALEGAIRDRADLLALLDETNPPPMKRPMVDATGRERGPTRDIHSQERRTRGRTAPRQKHAQGRRRRCRPLRFVAVLIGRRSRQAQQQPQGLRRFGRQDDHRSGRIARSAQNPPIGGISSEEAAVMLNGPSSGNVPIHVLSSAEAALGAGFDLERIGLRAVRDSAPS